MRTVWRRARWMAWPAVLAAGLAGCAGGTSGGGQVPVSGVTVSSKVLLPGERSITPELRGADLRGRPFDVRAWRGKVVVVNFWGSWCAPCRIETPELVRAAKRAAPLGVEFAGVDVRDGKAAAQAFVRRYDVPYPSLFDPQLRSALSFGSMAPRALPATFVLDRRGRLAAFFFGAVTERSLLAVVRPLAEEPRD